MVLFNTSKNSILELEEQEEWKSVKSNLKSLQLKLTRATKYLPKYDQNIYKNFITETTEKLNVAESKSRSTFTFKKSSIPTPSTLSDLSTRTALSAALSAESADSVPLVSTQIPSSMLDMCSTIDGVKLDPTQTSTNHSSTSSNKAILSPRVENQTITITSKSTDVVLTNHHSSTIKFTTPLTTLFLSNMTNCIIGPVDVQSSVFIEKLENVVVGCRARQVRCHGCVNVIVYGDLGSGPIIEDCVGMTFRPLERKLLPNVVIVDGMNKDGGGANHYARVEDFNWQKQTASPNFKVQNETAFPDVHVDGLTTFDFAGIMQ